jgi:hypothetical protein
VTYLSLWFVAGAVDFGLNVVMLVLCLSVGLRPMSQRLVDQLGSVPLALGVGLALCLALGPIGIGLTIAKMPRFAQQVWGKWQTRGRE